MLRRTLITGMSALALLGAGCGGDDGDEQSADEKAVREVLAKLENYSIAGNGKAICQELFTEALVQSVKAAAASKNCSAEVKRNVFTPDATVDVRSIDLPDARNAVARVTVQNGVKDVIYLVKAEDDSWRIRSVQQE